MLISINSKFIDGPYGGGMQFANFMKQFLEEANHTVINNLDKKNIDIILHVNPFPFLMNSSAFSFLDAYAYKLKNPETIIIQRINECDERKGTNYMNKLQIATSKYSDFIVFIASWLHPLYEESGLEINNNFKVILNGADKKVFNTENKSKYIENEKLKIVTHHWGAGLLKGHDIYQKLDKLLENNEINKYFEFTFIGNVPKELKYNNTRIVNPLYGKELAEELKKHHIYLTASRNEPAGMHHIEGALCGLPLLYINSGALPEYCNNFGICFSENNFEEKLNQMKLEFQFYESEMIKYKNTASKMAEEYLKLFHELIANREKYAFKHKKTLKSFFFSIYSKIYTLRNKIKFKI